ncbi:MAG: methionine synthase [Euryarchaeota archaeon]|nr:methionine synthase [Euryarchaeota archaeon]
MFYKQEIGSMKKPDYLISAYGKEEFHTLKKRALKETVELMESAGLDNIGIGGEMYRWEMYENPVDHLDGLVYYGRVRSFDNRYYKKASVVGKIKRKSSAYLEEFIDVQEIAKKDIKVPITGPYTLMDWSFNDYYPSRLELGLDFARAVREEIIELEKHWKGKGPLRVQIDEPAASTHPWEVSTFVEIFNETVKNLNNVKISSHICYSKDYRSLYPYILEMKTTQLALEFSNRDTINLGIDDDSRRGFRVIKDLMDMGENREIGIGVIDVHTDFIEPPELVRDRILYVAKFYDIEKIIINPDCGLRTRSREVAYKKLRSLVEGTKLAEKGLS